MNEMIKMVVVLTVLSAFSGGLLAAVKGGTAEKIEIEKLKNVKAPALMKIFEGASNDPVTDRFKLKDGETERSFFVGILDGDVKVALESFGKGYGGDVGLMVGINVGDDTILSAEVTTHAETPGLGARAKDDPGLVSQFKGLTAGDPVKVTSDGGKINAMGGATITSRAVCGAATDVGEIYKRMKPQLEEKLKEFSK